MEVNYRIRDGYLEQETRDMNSTFVEAMVGFKLCQFYATKLFIAWSPELHQDAAALGAPATVECAPEIAITYPPLLQHKYDYKYIN